MRPNKFRIRRDWRFERVLLRFFVLFFYDFLAKLGFLINFVLFVLFFKIVM